MPLSTLQTTPRGIACKTRGQDGFAASFPVGLFHPLQHAGLSRRSPCCRQSVRNVNSAWGACTPAPLPAPRRSTHFKPLGILKSPHATTACGAPSRSSDLNGQGRPRVRDLEVVSSGFSFFVSYF